MSADCWYFAYGSNLEPGRMTDRTGPIREVAPARLDGFRFAFNKLGRDGTGKANIIAAPDSQVLGVVYLCGPAAMEQLDSYEGAPTHYRREPVTVALDDGTTLEAITYVAQPDRIRDGLRPSADYLECVVSGAQAHGLPAEYMDEIRSVA